VPTRAFLEDYEEKQLIRCGTCDLCSAERTRTGKLFILGMRVSLLRFPRSSRFGRLGRLEEAVPSVGNGASGMHGYRAPQREAAWSGVVMDF
jgi:hypothetical protein